ncbi:hypothetical protein [Chryseobacterium vrystaatense]|uniref:Uncharacterized protein n=1 Tax=Chryseobacterium vrystaatense TaxID=307480 RepID=A0A1M5IK36_9FLAO|nr:hypothetical protein [Chryseobacterium vrystaatense]SHG28419.1 hypothetical protein SAMN02787073_3892 [Chryseobacterium vrystaatense]
MKTIHKNTPALRQQIMKSAVASFKIEGIKISADTAAKTLKKIEAKMAESSR